MHLFLTVHLEGILSSHLETGKTRGLVDNRIVITVAIQTEVGKLGSLITPAGAHRHEGVHVERTETGRKATHTAKTESTEVTGHIQLSFTTEETGTLAHFAVVSRETVFENEANLVAVTEVFRALQAKAGAGILTGGFLELVGFRRAVVKVLILQAEVDLTVEGHIGSHRGTGKRAENGDRNKSLLHNGVLQKLNLGAAR